MGPGALVLHVPIQMFTNLYVIFVWFTFHKYT